MIPKPLESIAEADIQSLIANAVAEGKTIEYKEALPGNADADKKEFLADVSSFANTAGGDLLFGVAENQGVPTAISGLGTTDLDLEMRRLDSIIAAGVDPRLRYSAQMIDCSSARRVLVLRIEHSWVGPHRVIFKGHDKFYARNSTGKYPLDVGELRTAFTMAATITERIRAFRVDRVIAISNNRTPVPFSPDPKLILHCVPLESFAGQAQFDVLRYYRSPERLRPMGSSGWSYRINLDGVVTYSGADPYVSYTQVYRNGTLEAVHGRLLGHEHQGRRAIPSIAYEEQVFRYLPVCFQILQELGCSTPVIVALSLTNVKGLHMGVGDMEFDDTDHPIDTETLMLPETVVEDFATPPGKILKPIFDLVWNACGYPESKNFDADGNWVRRR